MSEEWRLQDSEKWRKNAAISNEFMERVFDQIWKTRFHLDILSPVDGGQGKRHRGSSRGMEALLLHSGSSNGTPGGIDILISLHLMDRADSWRDNDEALVAKIN